ncbi:MAG: type II toxin-antitoxin system VapC family toxin [Candidatus Methanomethyliaceae archaeon]|nr:type II toxin-antitoxin system VapC family toxin [Candidatus Verstraetearchaeota archaeon]
MTYLFDASAIVNLVKKGRLLILSKGSTLELALYESLNAILKEYVLLKKLDHESAVDFVKILSEIFGNIKTESIRGLETEVFNLAAKFGLTIYDASYLLAALNNNLTLVTDDSKLRSALKEILPVKSTEEVIGKV